jgi:hypothetical protein
MQWNPQDSCQLLRLGFSPSSWRPKGNLAACFSWRQQESIGFPYAPDTLGVIPLEVHPLGDLAEKGEQESYH